jgi:hypothetical protein
MGKVFDALIEKFPNAAGFAAKFVVALFAVRAALAGLGYVFAPVFWAFRAFKLVLTPFAKLFNYAFLKPMRGILNLGGRIASGLMSGFGRLFAYLFPRLASWVVSTYAAIAPYLLVAAAIAAIVVVSHDLWTMWKGGKFEDTWIGQALKAVKSFGGKIWDKLGFSMPDFGSGDAQTADGASVASKLSDHASAMMDTTDHMVQRQGPKAAQALTGTVVHQGGDNKTVSYTINAPVTINAPSADAGTTRQLTAHVQDAIKDTWETILSSTKTAATPAADY